MKTSNFNPTPLYRLIEKTDFLCTVNENNTKNEHNTNNEGNSDDLSKDIFNEANMMCCFNPTDFYKLIVTNEWGCFRENDVPEKLKKTYYFDPTELYKLIETKSWDKVEQRISDYPEEAAIWVTRMKKDGSLRWKMLPLHALLVLKAPTKVILQTLQSFPKAAKCADDQGMLPMHLALTNDDVDDLVIRNLIKENPKGLLSKDQFGRTPLALRGEATVSCYNAALALEKASISKREKESSQFKLSSERELHNKKIKKIEDEVNALFRDFIGSEIESLEKRDMISMKENEILEMKLSQIDLVSQSDSSEHSLEIQKKNSKENAQEIVWLHALTTQQNREINEKNQKIKCQSKKISELKVSKKSMKASLKIQKEISSDLQIEIDDLHRNISHLQNTYDLQSKISSYVDTMKKQQHVCDLLTSQVKTLEMAVEKKSEHELPSEQSNYNWTRNFSTLFNNFTNVI